MSTSSRFADDLLKWFSSNQRDFPWRRSTNPYQILIAEMLLRKTTAAQAEEVFPNLIKKYTSPAELASADERDLKEIIAPLGMQNIRTRLLKELGRSIIERYGGDVPSSEKDIMSLPGVGRYAASAVRCLAYGERVPMLDTNAIRVIQRLFGITSRRARPRNDPYFWKIAEDIMPSKEVRQYNLAMLDFAAAVCVPRNPRCPICFAKTYCNYALSLGLYST